MREARPPRGGAPWFKVYAADELARSHDQDAETVGARYLLRLAAWIGLKTDVPGHLPNADEALAKLAKLAPKRFLAKKSELLAGYSETEDGALLYRQGDLDDLAEVSRKSEVRANAGRAGGTAPRRVNAEQLPSNCQAFAKRSDQSRSEQTRSESDQTRSSSDQSADDDDLFGWVREQFRRGGNSKVPTDATLDAWLATLNGDRDKLREVVERLQADGRLDKPFAYIRKVVDEAAWELPEDLGPERPPEDGLYHPCGKRWSTYFGRYLPADEWRTEAELEAARGPLPYGSIGHRGLDGPTAWDGERFLTASEWIIAHPEIGLPAGLEPQQEGPMDYPEPPDGCQHCTGRIRWSRYYHRWIEVAEWRPVADLTAELGPPPEAAA